jgi:Nif-specific regulatory protein
MSFALVQLNGTDPGMSVELLPDGPAVTIGRDAAREIPVDDHMCSRLHSRVWFDGTDWRVEDCGSRNGTWLNSRQIENETLRPGDAIRVGDRVFVFVQQGAAVPGVGWDSALIESTTFVSRVPSTEQKEAVVKQLKERPDPDSVRNAEILCRLAGELHEKETVEDMLTTVCEALQSGTKANGIVIWLSGTDGRLRRYGAEPTESPGAPSPLASLVMDQREAVLVKQTGDSGSSLESTVIDERPTSAICVPIPHRASCRGAIEILRTNALNPLQNSNLQLAIAVARQAGLALENLDYREKLERANIQLRSEVSGRNRIIGDSEPVRRLLDVISRISPTESRVLIQGESGTGKELIARMIHDSSSRAGGPYVAVNCASFNEALLESELFGHEKGAFTGADRQHFGQFERAHKGTIFLDEVGEMSLSCQAKLLRVIEGQSFERLGGMERIEVDARIIAATHRNLPERVKADTFREDLYFRLGVIEVSVPPLRDRGDDVLLLATGFLQEFREKTGRGPVRISRSAATVLAQHAWPGNVRELRNAIERAAVLGLEEEVLPTDLGLHHADESSMPSGSQPLAESTSLADAELQHIQRVLDQCGGNKTKACRVLNIGRGTLYKKLNDIEERGRQS